MSKTKNVLKCILRGQNTCMHKTLTGSSKTTVELYKNNFDATL